MDYSLETRHIKLRPLTSNNAATLFKWRNDQQFLQNCSHRRSATNCNEFVAELKRDFERDRHLQFMIERKFDGEPIGTIYSYDYKRVDGYAFITTFIADGFRKRGYGAEADALFLMYLFEKFKLFKIYMEMYEYNREAISAALRGGFIEEGKFKKQRLFNGARYDVIRYALFRENIPRISEFLNKLK